MRAAIITLYLFSLLFFESISIFPQDFWSQTKGPYGGPVSCIAINSQNHIYAGTSNNIIRYSTNNGITWNVINHRFQDYITAIEITKENIFFAADRFGVYRSSDNGVNWAKVLSANTVLDLAVNSKNELFAGAYFGGIYRSENNGADWDSLGLPYMESIEIDKYDNIYVQTMGSIFRSSNNGESWDEILSALLTSIHASPNNFLLAGAYDTTFISYDSGVTWKEIEQLDSLTASSFITNARGETLGFFVNRVNYRDYRIYIGDNKGENWQHIYSSKESVSGSVVNTNGEIFAASYGIIHSEDNGFTWTILPFIATQVFSVIVNPENGNIFAATNSKIFRSTNRGDSWDKINDDIYSYGVISSSPTGILYSGVSHIYRSTDNGDNWSRTNLNLQSGRVISLIADAKGNLLAGIIRDISPCPCETGIYLSTNEGDSWNFVNNEPAISFAIDSMQNYYAGIYSGILKSVDYGLTWNRIGNLSLPVKDILVNKNNNIFAATDSGVFLSIDNGNNWLKITNGINSNNFKLIEANQNGELFATDNTGTVYFSSSNGDFWKIINSGLKGNQIYDLAIDPEGYVFGASNSSGVFRSTSSTITSINDKSLSHTFNLYQNYPNPFNPVTIILYQIPGGSSSRQAGMFVQLFVYDILGNEIITLVKEYKNPGIYKVEFNANNLSSGVYFYKLSAGNNTITKKMVLIR